MSAIRFDDRVAIVTGAGGGLGRAYALELARRGAKVVVNDLGGSLDGAGGSSEAALAVVAAIEAQGGQAIADGASVTDEAGVSRMVESAMSAFGRIDILIANAGILRDKSFAKMSLQDFQAVLAVHLMGAVIPAHAVWPIMRAQSYGRLLFTTSASGLYGNFGQSNYGAAKLALIGLMNTLKLEGVKDNIRANAIAPVAATRMTSDVLPAQLAEGMKPELVAAGAVHLVSDDAPNGAILSAGGGGFALAHIVETAGAALGQNATAEAVRDAWDRIASAENAQPYESGAPEIAKMMKLAGLI